MVTSLHIPLAIWAPGDQPDEQQRESVNFMDDIIILTGLPR